MSSCHQPCHANQRSKLTLISGGISPINFFLFCFVQKIEAMFEEALDMAHNQVLHILEQIWVRFIDQASNYTSHITGMPTRPATAKDVADALAEGIREKSANHRNMGTNREFWVNKRTQISQWSKPYTTRTFRAQDIELETFVQILIRKDVFPRRYFFKFTLQN